DQPQRCAQMQLRTDAEDDDDDGDCSEEQRHVDMGWRRPADRPEEDSDKDEQEEQPTQVLQLLEPSHRIAPGRQSATDARPRTPATPGARRPRSGPNASMGSRASVRRRAPHPTRIVLNVRQVYSGAGAASASAGA